MAAFPDLIVSKDDWVELYSSTGIQVGTAVIIQNKGSVDILINNDLTKPDIASQEGYSILNHTSDVSGAHLVLEGTQAAWIKASPSGRGVSGRVSVQTLDGIMPVTRVESTALDKLALSLETGSETRQNTIARITDESNRVAMVSMTGELQVGFKVDDISVNFQYGISPRDIKNGGVSTGTGSVGSFKSTATVSSGTGVGSSTLQSVDSIRYRAGHECSCAVSIVFPPPQLNINMYAGFMNGEDGWCVGYKGLDFGLWFIEGGNYNFIPKSTWNWDKLDGSGPSRYNINPQTGQLYRLSFTWHGFLDLLLEVRTRDGRWVPAHKEVFVNEAVETHLENPNLPVSVKIERLSGSGANATIKTGSWRAGVIAGVEENNASDRWFAHTRLDASLSNANNNIFTVRNKLIYQGKTNHIAVELAIVTFDSTANKSVAVYGNYDATLSGNGAYTSIDATSSTLEVSQGGTVLGGTRGPATVIKAGGDRRTDVRDTGIIIHPGRTFTFEVVPGGPVNGAFSISARFKEPH